MKRYELLSSINRRYFKGTDIRVTRCDKATL